MNIRLARIISISSSLSAFAKANRTDVIIFRVRVYKILKQTSSARIGEQTRPRALSAPTKSNRSLLYKVFVDIKTWARCGACVMGMMCINPERFGFARIPDTVNANNAQHGH